MGFIQYLTINQCYLKRFYSSLTFLDKYFGCKNCVSHFVHMFIDYICFLAVNFSSHFYRKKLFFPFNLCFNKMFPIRNYSSIFIELSILKLYYYFAFFFFSRICSYFFHFHFSDKNSFFKIMRYRIKL